MKTNATLRLVDRGEQGVCPDGHPCYLTSTGGPRAVFGRGCVAGEYAGLPLIVWDLTVADIDAAEAAGADPVIVAWARSTVADRAPADRYPA